MTSLVDRDLISRLVCFNGSPKGISPVLKKKNISKIIIPKKDISLQDLYAALANKYIVTQLEVQWVYTVQWAFSVPTVGHCTCTACHLQWALHVATLWLGIVYIQWLHTVYMYVHCTPTVVYSAHCSYTVDFLANMGCPTLHGTTPTIKCLPW